MDKQLRSALAQWAQQPLNESDRVVLAARELRGSLRSLQPALDRLSADPGAILSTAEDRDRRALLAALEAAAPGRGEHLLGRVRLLSWAAELDADHQCVLGGALLDGVLVPLGRGATAFRALRSSFQAAAAQRSRTSSRDWLAAIDAAGIEVIPDGVGVHGVRERARVQALEEYRRVLVAKLDVLDLSMLFEGIREVRVPGLASTFQVTWRPAEAQHDVTTDLLKVARRNDRFIVTGLPGMGKSSAFRQLAAAWAADSEAPFPVLLDLKGIGGSIHSRSDVSLGLLLSQAVQLCANIEPAILEMALRDELKRGNIVLLVDGLDETLEKAGVTAAGLADLLPQLPEKCGFILSTRVNALVAAQQTGLPCVELSTPTRLLETLTALLKALAAHASSDELGTWLPEKRSWLERSMKERTDVWDVPLLATLMTHRAAMGGAESPNAAALLNDVIKDSVDKWEQRRNAAPPGGNDKELRSEMLISGFAVIGHALNSQAELTAVEAQEMISADLDPWELSGPVARSIANQVLWFWDNAMGVFVEVNEKIQARSRQFSELADAYWAIGRNTPQRIEWLEQAIHSDSKREAVEIAIISNRSMMEHLFQQANVHSSEEVRARTLSWIIYVSRKGAISEDDQLLGQLIGLLGRAACEGLVFEEERDAGGIFSSMLTARSKLQADVDGPGWVFAQELASFPFPVRHRVRRDALLLKTNYGPAHTDIIRAAIALTDAEFDDRAALTEAERASVRAVIDTDLPDSVEPIRIPGKPLEISAAPVRIITGVEVILYGASKRISEFADDTPAKIYAFARQLPADAYMRVSAVLGSAGIRNMEYRNPFSRIRPEWSELAADFDGWGWLLRALADSEVAAAPQNQIDNWRWRALSDLIWAMGYTDASPSGLLRAAGAHPDTIRAWAAAIARAASIDPAAIAAQAHELLTRSEDIETITKLIDSYRLVDLNVEPGRLSSAHLLRLIPVLMSASDWMSWSAFELLVHLRSASIAQAIRDHKVTLTPMTVWRTTLVLCANSPDPISDAKKMLASKHSAQRAGAGFFLRHENDGKLGELLQTAMSDDDLTVRSDAGAVSSDSEPLYWSCRWCAEKNSLEDTNCRGCDLSSRPKAER